jgi:7-cyano-7-deazaguanine synthase
MEKTVTKSALVLLSGGMDSTTALAWALKQGPVAAAVSVNYGQRHAKELDVAAKIAQHYGVRHLILDLRSWGSLLTGSALTDPAIPVPEGHYAAPSMSATVVPNRNATMLMAAAGIAESLGASVVITAVHAGDHAVYPDCRPDFIEAASHAAHLGTGGKVSILAPFVDISKTEICELGTRLGAPLSDTWSCYKGGDLHCGKCGTCYERREAFDDSDTVDLTDYETNSPYLADSQP